jgi:hypothetical protein
LCVIIFTHRPLYPSVKSPDIHWIGGWPGPGTSLDDMEKRKNLPLSSPELRSAIPTALSWFPLKIPRDMKKLKERFWKCVYTIGVCDFSCVIFGRLLQNVIACCLFTFSRLKCVRTPCM